MFRFLKILVVSVILFSFVERMEAQTFYIKGAQYSLRNKLVEFVIIPKVDSVVYNWYQYSDTTVQRISLQEEDTAFYYTKSYAKSGIIKCEIRDSITNALKQIVSFPLAIVTNYVDVSALAKLSKECAEVSNDNNLCNTNYIDYFEIEEIKYTNNGCVVGGYQDLTSSGYTTSLDMGLNYTVILKPKAIYLNALQQYSNLYYGVWIDYNNDGDFDDPGEFIKDGESNQLTANIINIEILNNDSYAGSRRLRVGMNSTSGFTSSSACSVVSAAGEIEDYIVKINKVGSLYGPNLLTPNNDGFNDFLIIKGLDPDETKIRTLEIFDSFGQKVKTIEGYKNNYEGLDEDGKLLKQGVYYYYFTNELRKFKSFFEIKY